MRKHRSFGASFLHTQTNRLPRHAPDAHITRVFEVETQVALFSAGIFGPWSRGSAKGLTAQQALEVHPHHAQWVELAGLVADGAAYAKARQSGAPRTRQIPSTAAAAAAAEPRGSSSGPRGGSGRERDEGRDTKGSSSSSSSSKLEKEKGAARKKERSSSKKNKGKSRPSREEEGEGGLREGLLDAAAASEPATAA
eukprot:COSAG06_NODE_10233_length_1722_cov_1.637708_1_plen_195_part_10